MKVCSDERLAVRQWGGGVGVAEIVGFVDTRFVVICFDMRKSR